MRRLLLDTHVLLWLLVDPTKIRATTLSIVRDRQNELLISPASAWEIATKHRLGRLGQAQTVINGYTSHLETLGATELPITGRDALTAGQMTWDHQDPFDRMLVAQAMIRSLVLVTKDDEITNFGGVNVVW
ncbi:type II toxin-antitoxin system VapC family toxin [soil metagenome]